MKKSLLLSFIFVFALVVQVLAQNRTVTGKVTDQETGQGLPGVTVLVKGTSSGTATGVDGGFTIAVPSNDAILVMRYVGYDAKEVAVGGQSVVNVQLAQSSESLSEVVVVGYGTESREKVVGSVATVSPKEIESVPLTSVDQIIQGRSPGVLSTTGSGQPGATTNVRVRGVGSISAGSAPLYVIDGIPVAVGDLTRNTETSNLMANINPNDIESISILKDAAATSLYGARAANGVILITTKRGKAGATKFTLRSQYGFNEKNQGNYRAMTSAELLEYERESIVNAGGNPDALRPLTILDNGVSTKWVDYAYQTGATQSYELNASGGDEKTRFFLSGSYFDQQGTLIGTQLERYSGRLNVDHKATDKLSLGVNLGLSRTNQESATAGNSFQSPILGSFLLLPYDRAQNEDGTWNNNFMFGTLNNDNFAYTVRQNDRLNYTGRALGTFTVGYDILKNLKFNGVLGLDYISILEDEYTSPNTNDGEDVLGRSVQISTTDITKTAQATLNYFTSINNVHNFDVLVGYELQDNNYNTFDATGTGFANDRLRVLSTAAVPEAVGGSGSSYGFLSYLSRLNYDFADKYYLTTSFRRDGSSRFGANNRWANFWAVGLSWRINQEDFMKDIDLISDLKLRTSYGTSGNADIANFGARGLYGYGASYNGIPGSSPSQVANPDLTWEKSKSFNIGLDYGILDSRITGSVEYYKRNTSDLLLNVPISSTSGFTTALRNVGEMVNKGVEVEVSTENLRGNFGWTTDFNIAFNRNEVIKLNNDQDILGGTQITKVGEPIYSFYLREWKGVNPANGEPLWSDGKGGVTSEYANAPRSLQGSANPDFFGGLTNTFTYKNFELSGFFYFTYGGKIYNDARRILEGDGAFFGYNQSASSLDRWQQPGDITNSPKAVRGNSSSSNQASTRFLEDASFIRLRNVMLAYNVPSSLSQKLKMNSVRVYAQGQNLWTKTEYTGFDPELAINGTEFFRYPNSKTVTFGLDLSF
ncbi:SusC/RagA family TonB-linked outer membrane protein [Pontibacter pudoricolor]|uniref:SusC/RagA family TonB-linked outer membrane protein n=1 Tax=Pontibacter pudoricolor TaxID=2694930 RepID=UPI00139135C6|nr:TonB-dependent receptor [Pontibacter pudoricolor]